MNIIEEARLNPSGITAFLKANHVRKHNYDQWFKRLKLQYPDWIKKLPPNKKVPIARFVPVLVKVGKGQEAAGKSKTLAKEENTAARGTIEIRLAKGHLIHVPNEVDRETFLLLLKGLND